MRSRMKAIGDINCIMTFERVKEFKKKIYKLTEVCNYVMEAKDVFPQFLN